MNRKQLIKLVDTLSTIRSEIVDNDFITIRTEKEQGIMVARYGTHAVTFVSSEGDELIIDSTRAESIFGFLDIEVSVLKKENEKLLAEADKLVGFDEGKVFSEKLNFEIENLNEYLHMLEVNKIKIFAIENNIRINIFPNSKKSTLIKKICDAQNKEYINLVDTE